MLRSALEGLYWTDATSHHSIASLIPLLQKLLELLRHLVGEHLLQRRMHMDQGLVRWVSDIRARCPDDVFLSVGLVVRPRASS